MKITRINPSYVIVENQSRPAIHLNNGCVIVMTKCWYSGTNYNLVHNYYTVEFDKFFIDVPCRKGRTYSFHTTKNALEKEKIRAEKIAKSIADKFISNYKLIAGQ